jgi:hypothetical protein
VIFWGIAQHIFESGVFQTHVGAGLGLQDIQDYYATYL